VLPETAIQEAMARLEADGQSEAFTTRLSGMMDLYFLANSLRMHDVCSSIELWMDAHPRVALPLVLRRLLAETELPGCSAPHERDQRIAVFQKWMCALVCSPHLSASQDSIASQNMASQDSR
jgi:hypothetical protein